MKLANDRRKSFEITEGVLQGEILSPLLFILYVSDFESFFRGRGFRGLSVDSVQDLLMPTYADDTALLCHCLADVKSKLVALKEYCGANGLVVNTSKTKVLPFRTSGRIHADERNAFKYDVQCLETVKCYEYLGVKLESKMEGSRTVSHAVGKASLAIGVTKSILSKAKSDAWGTKVKLFDSVVAPTLLYATASWGLGHFEQIEVSQNTYYKQILLLSPGTPGYALRIELGLRHLAVRVLELTINWIIRVLKMEEHRLPLVRYKRLMFLMDKPSNVVKFNWLSKMYALLSEFNMEFLCFVTDPEIWGKQQKESYRKV